MWVSARLQPYLFASIACLGLAGFASYDLFRERERAIQQARTQTANLAVMFEEHARQNLRRVEAVLNDAQDSIGSDSMETPSATQGSASQQRLNAALPSDALVSGLMWLGDDGRLIASKSSASSEAGFNAASDDLFRDWLPRLSAEPNGTLLFGKLLRLSSGQWRLPVGRRSAGANGLPPGVLVASVDLSALQAVFDAINVGNNGFITVFLNDGWMLATSPRNDPLIAKNWFESPMFKEHMPRSRAGTVQQVVVRDGTERIYSYRALAEYPVVVSTGISLTDALADWRARTRWDAFLVALTAVVSLFGAAAMSRTYARREAAELAAAEAARQTQAIVDHAADAIVTYRADGTIESVNQACVAMFGHAAAELTGRSMTALLPGFARGGERAGTAQESFEVGRTANVGRRADGREFPIELAVTDVPRSGEPLHIALIRDVTEQLRAQAAVSGARDDAQRSERFLRMVTDNVPLRIAYVDRELRYRFVNKANCEWFALPREAILGHTRQELTGKPLPAELNDRIGQVFAGQAQHFELEQVEGGHTTAIETFLVPDIGEGGAVAGVYATSADVTERYTQQRRIEQALAERETLLREVYHRVKNNLQVIQSLLNLQRRGLPEGVARSALDDSFQRVHAMALVHEKLYQTGHLEALSLRDYAGDLLGHLGDSAGAAARGITLTADVDPVDVTLETAVPLGLLLTELVGNSLKHGFPANRGGTVRVQVARAGADLRLQVSDDGVGLPDGFDLDRTDSMGLQLAASLAAQLGGRLLAGNEHGAVFSTALPHMA